MSKSPWSLVLGPWSPPPPCPPEGGGSQRTQRGKRTQIGINGTLLCVLAHLCGLCAFSFPALAQESPAEPVLFEGRGRLVCLLEEMKERFKAAVPPVHAHLVGFRMEKVANGGLRYYTLLRTPSSEALFDDPRFQKHELRLKGRVFPATGLLELGEFQWYRDGKLYDTYYWCEICSIRSVQPGICVCCQDPVEFREAPAEPDKNK